MSTSAGSVTSVLLAARSVGQWRARRRPESPAALARRLDPKFVVTPTIQLLSDLAVRSVTCPDQRDVVTTPPRTGKSRLLAIWTVVWALMRDPDALVVLVSYSDELAQTHSREARQIITEHGDLLGFRLSPDKTSAGRWRVDGRAGGLLAAGIGSGLTGHGGDLIILDDVVKNAAEADSAAHRRRIANEYRSTVATRVHPRGSVVLVMTRWHPEDLAGTLLRDEPDVWRHTNIPAVSEVGIDDALGRAPGVVMTSALGYTAEHFAAARRTSGERSWYALYQGSPTTLEGGLVKRDWLDGWRLPSAPPRSLRTVVGVDPSDSGSGDACGLVAASVSTDGTVAVIADISAPMTSDQWARAAVDLAIDVGATEIGVEGYAARDTYVRVVNDALRRARPERPIRVTSWPPRGSGRGGGDAIARSAALLQGLEVGTVRMAGHLPELEDAAVGWQVGQHQPDALAALVVAHDLLVHAFGAQVAFASPLDVERRMREREPSLFADRMSRPGLGAASPVAARLSRTISGGGYDPLVAPRKTLRNL